MKVMRTAGLRLAAGLSALLCAAGVAAHDFWVEPGSFSPAPGQVVPVRLRVGEHHQGEPVGRPAAAGMHRFVVAPAGGSAPATVPGRTGADPAGLFRPADAGGYVIGFHGKQIAIELPAETFNAYLKEEGLDAIVALRAERGQLDSPGLELYSRCAKSLLLAGADSGTGATTDRAIGLPLELVAERDPWRVRSGESLPVRILYQGRALAGALVIAMPRAAPHERAGPLASAHTGALQARRYPSERVAQRSDADGRVWLPLGREGPWLVKAVHMVGAAPGSGADWESLWASLTFSGGAGDDDAPAAKDGP